MLPPSYVNPKNRAAFDEEKLPGLNEIVMDEELAAAILKASRTSMGMDASPVDMANVVTFCERMVKLAEYRRDLYAYLVDKVCHSFEKSKKMQLQTRWVLHTMGHEMVLFTSDPSASCPISDGCGGAEPGGVDRWNRGSTPHF